MRERWILGLAVVATAALAAGIALWLGREGPEAHVPRVGGQGVAGEGPSTSAELESRPTANDSSEVASSGSAPERVGLAGDALGASRPSRRPDDASGERLVRGVVVDRRTDEPVPDFEFDLLHLVAWTSDDGSIWRADHRELRLRSNDRGEFESAEPFPIGGYLGGPWVASRRLETAPAEELVAFDGSEVRIPVDVGPTYFLRFSEDVDPEETRMRASLRVGSTWSPANLSFAATRVRGGGSPWVRFDWSDAIEEHLGSDATLGVVSADQLLAGSGELHLELGVHRTPVDVHLHGFAGFRGRVASIDGEPIADAVVVLDDGLGRSIRLTPRPTGELHQALLQPGTYTITASSPRHETLERLVVLQLGPSEEVELRLAEIPAVGSIRGKLTTATGEHRPFSKVYLDALAPRSAQFEAPVTWQREAEGWVGTFEFADMPAGAYAPSLITDDLFAWEGGADTVTAPFDGLDYFCADDVDLVDLVLRVVDDHTGSALESFEGRWYSEVDWDEFASGGTGFVRLVGGFPEGRPIQWSVWADGYGVARGDESAFTDRAGDTRVATVRLVPGHDVLVEAWDDADHPVAGVRVIVDGRHVATTDADGVALAPWPAEANTVEFEHAELSWDGGTLSPGGTAKLGEGERHVEVLLR